MIKNWICCISGFLQSKGQDNGTFKLWKKLGVYRSPNTAVSLHEWNSDFSEIAAIIEKSGVQNVLIFAYSWGAGNGAKRLSVELLKKGINVKNMVLSDPVYRSPLWIFSWQALLNIRSITYPRNVWNIDYFVQQNIPPKGHTVKIEDKTIEPVILNSTHLLMDDHEEYHNKCLEVTQNVLNNAE